MRIGYLASVILLGAVVAWPQAPPRTFTNSIGMKFVRIDPGSFKMGSDRDDAEEKPVHDVTLSKGFYLQATEVTQAQWQAVMGSNPSKFKGPDLPVEQVSWNDAQEFLQKLNAKERGARYRLPTEAEWEYAARAGQAGAPAKLDAVAWYDKNSGTQTHAVGQKQANGWGLYDMLGNVWEWCADWHDSEYYGKSPSVDPPGPTSGTYRVLRGGSWYFNARIARVALRVRDVPASRLYDRGFRCARTLVAQQSKPAAVPPRESTNFVAIPPGEFQMGCSPGDGECNEDEKPTHRVRITKGFELGKYEVTQAQWEEVMGSNSNPSKFKGADRPVEQVSWNDVQGFIAKLNGRKDGYRYRLPTEAEWEYAARAGSTGKYAGELGEMGWYDGNQTHPVGQKKGNGWGLYDMHGNVWEWCADGKREYAAGQATDPRGPDGGDLMLRGGAWGKPARFARVSSRFGFFRGFPGLRLDNGGFRCARERIP